MFYENVVTMYSQIMAAIIITTKIPGLAAAIPVADLNATMVVASGNVVSVEYN